MSTIRIRSSRLNTTEFGDSEKLPNDEKKRLSKELIECQIRKKRKCLHTKRKIDHHIKKHVIKRSEFLVSSKRTSVEIYIIEDVEKRERKIENEKVGIERHDSERELRLFPAQRALFER